MTKPKLISAKDAMSRLQSGNRRFVKNRGTGLTSAVKNTERLKLKSRGPFAIILSCSDSRAPSELLFDQGLGDLFVIRVAGNIVAPSLVGSIEFAVATTNARLVVVMGHTQCGAIQTTYDSMVNDKDVLSENIYDIVYRIRPHIRHLIEPHAAAKKSGTDSPEDEAQVLREAMRANVEASVRQLQQASRFLEEAVLKKKIRIVGAEYDIESGVVNFFETPRTSKKRARIGR
jgi:carbonic anhydrase